ncbi:MAG: DUF2147 domain-containing protein [Blastochloris viridis]|uniref:DUF2147 domain-containing protein n=1 Tax=Blastochloris viridis TaxID=1079 RepID=A0A6N4RBI7_BLAVI|nr:MAG: DUF2147 domain-containing protein [Blastochloris viridis]
MTKLLTGALLLVAGSAMAAEPIQGTWRTAGGELVEAARCDKQYCLTLKTGQYAGQKIGELKGDSIHYKGTVTDPKDNKSYTGSANISTPFSGPQTLELKGCVLKFLCKSQSWEKVTGPGKDKIAL